MWQHFAGGCSNRSSTGKSAFINQRKCPRVIRRKFYTANRLPHDRVFLIAFIESRIYWFLPFHSIITPVDLYHIDYHSTLISISTQRRLAQANHSPTSTCRWLWKQRAAPRWLEISHFGRGEIEAELQAQTLQQLKELEERREAASRSSGKWKQSRNTSPCLLAFPLPRVSNPHSSSHSLAFSNFCPSKFRPSECGICVWVHYFTTTSILNEWHGWLASWLAAVGGTSESWRSRAVTERTTRRVADVTTNCIKSTSASNSTIVTFYRFQCYSVYYSFAVRDIRYSAISISSRYRFTIALLLIENQKIR